jgi:hypothetical protein
MVVVGKGDKALFWSDRWLNGCNVETLAPNLWAAFSPRVRNKRIGRDALINFHWVCYISHAFTMEVLLQYLCIWDLLRGWQLSDTPDMSFGARRHPVNSVWSQPILPCFSVGCFCWVPRSSRRCRHQVNVASTVGWSFMVSVGLPTNSDDMVYMMTFALSMRKRLKTIDHLLLDCVHKRETWFWCCATSTCMLWFCSKTQSLLAGGFELGNRYISNKGVGLTHWCGWSLGRFGERGIEGSMIALPFNQWPSLRIFLRRLGAGR